MISRANNNQPSVWMIAAMIVGVMAISTIADEFETIDFGPEEDLVDFTEGDIDPGAQLEREVRDGQEQITITLDDVSLEDTVRLFTQATGANIIASAALLQDKRVTVNLSHVDWRPALRSILEIHDLELWERSPGAGVYSIRPIQPDAPPPTQIITYFLEYITAAEIRSPVQSMLRDGGSLTSFPSRNALVVRTTENNQVEIRDLIEELDRPGRQVLIETRILELTDDARKQVGIDWSVLGSYQVGITDMSRVFENERRRELTTRQRSMEFDQQTRRQGRLAAFDEDGMPLRGDLETWASMPDFEGSFREVEWEPSPWNYDFDERSRGMGAENVRDRTSFHGYSDIMSAILSPADFSLVLSALHSTDGVSIVSNPKMIVTSGSTNSFFSVGEREPIIETEIQRGTAESPGDRLVARLATDINTDFIRQGYLETGIDLRVVATVKTDDLIEADIRPSLRRLIDLKTVGDNSWPIISVKEIDTSFTLRSGQTVAIGGLTGLEEGKRTTRVPILGSIPIIGRLFRHEADIQNQTETIIFVTLTVADPEGLDNEAGIPMDSRLVHNRLLQEQTRREEFDRQRQLQLQAAEEERLARRRAAEAAALEAAEAAAAPTSGDHRPSSINSVVPR